MNEYEVSPTRLRWTGQSRAAFERLYLTDSFCLYHSFSVIVAQPLSFTFAFKQKSHIALCNYMLQFAIFCNIIT